MFATQLRRWFSGNVATIRFLPTFQEVADIVSLEHQAPAFAGVTAFYETINPLANC